MNEIPYPTMPLSPASLRQLRLSSLITSSVRRGVALLRRSVGGRKPSVK